MFMLMMLPLYSTCIAFSVMCMQFHDCQLIVQIDITLIVHVVFFFINIFPKNASKGAVNMMTNVFHLVHLSMTDSVLFSSY